MQADLGARRADAGGDAGNIHTVIGTLCGTKLPVEFQIYRIFPLLFDKLDPFRRARQQNVGGNLAFRQADVKLCVPDAGKFSVQCVFHVVLLCRHSAFGFPYARSIAKRSPLKPCRMA